ncbi:MAG TPA: PHP domain-containing protein [Beutenbergiaceae bacterium]|nr:PHP domain-containing protein [Beutenbergiaceae bacterium]
MAIDLHTHSSVSDGTDTPRELMLNAARAGLDVVALTDHDTTAGWAEAEAAVADSGVGLVRGTEISCTSEGISVHLLSYLHDPHDEELARVFTRSRNFRHTRAHTMVARINEVYPLTWEEVARRARLGSTIGRPHIADALVARGYVRDRTEAFENILSASGPFYVRYETPEVTRAVDLVVAAGGVPVVAHVRASARGRIITDEKIADLVDHGLAGIEVDHRDHTEADRAHLRGLAGELGVFMTGSSDYHGTGKPNRLGENTTDPGVLAEIEERGALDVIRP